MVVLDHGHLYLDVPHIAMCSNIAAAGPVCLRGGRGAYPACCILYHLTLAQNSLLMYLSAYAKTQGRQN